VRDIDAADEWLEAWTERAGAQAARAAQLAQRVAGLTARAENREGSVVVTVGAAGQVEDLELDDQMYDMSPPELSRSILAVMRSAQQRLTEQVAVQVRETVGLDSPTGQAVVDGFTRRFPSGGVPDAR
jgi:DNA-binding protein YbaB